MKAIILAAGEGKRLQPYTLDRPKCMVEINEISLIDRQIAVLEKEKIAEIVLIGGYKLEMLKGKGSRLKQNPIYAESNMVWTLFCAEEELEGEVIISYGDIVYSKDILQKLLKSEKDIAVIIDKDWENYWRERNENPLDDAETLRLNPDGRITEIGQKPQSISEIQGQYIGLMKFSAKGLKQIKTIFYKAKEDIHLLGKPVKEAYMTDLLQSVIDHGIEVSSVLVEGGWVEIDTVDDKNALVTINRLKKIHSQG